MVILAPTTLVVMAEYGTVVVECTRCKAVVAATVNAESEGYDEESSIPLRYQFASCPNCGGPILVERYNFGFDGVNDLSSPHRLYPPQQKALSTQIPETIRDAFREAQRCFDASCFTAAAIMCRRVIEEVIRQQGVSSKNLVGGLRELRSNDQIDARLFEWADLLRSIGNEAAHGVGEKIGPQDAEDVLHFTEALADYIYVLKTRFENLQNRRGQA